ncbi:MAG: type II toxin-antitoxin system HicA family toxin [Candidatus Aenigmarchaeota archaeon]|nr:type II toxin-antitoxin system HicA family toxin [Candidatus Aenigmarchaeota archaeon]
MQGKIHPLPRNEIIKILKSNGFEQVTVVKGRHLKFRKTTSTEVLTTMVSHRPEIQPSVIRDIMKHPRNRRKNFIEFFSRG